MLAIDTVVDELRVSTQAARPAGITFTTVVAVTLPVALVAVRM